MLHRCSFGITGPLCSSRHPVLAAAVRGLEAGRANGILGPSSAALLKVHPLASGKLCIDAEGEVGLLGKGIPLPARAGVEITHLPVRAEIGKAETGVHGRRSGQDRAAKLHTAPLAHSLEQDRPWFLATHA